MTVLLSSSVHRASRDGLPASYLVLSLDYYSRAWPFCRSSLASIPVVVAPDSMVAEPAMHQEKNADSSLNIWLAKPCARLDGYNGDVSPEGDGS